jgi:outer membrane immunogenic protein
MKYHIFGAIAVLAVSGLAAHAADLPIYKKAQMPQSIGAFSWTGFYAGVNAGYGFGGNDNVSTEGQEAPNIANIAGGARPGFVSLDRSGFIGGGQLGYNYQAGQFLAGFETDIAYTDFRDTENVGTTQLVTGLPLNNTFRSRIDYLGTVRGRLGYSWDRTLFYATGGLAYGETKHSVDMFGPTGNTQFSGAQSSVKAGYAIGAGIEYALTDKISAKTEYLYYNLGKDTLNVAVISGSGGRGTGYNSHFEDDGQIVRVGLNYKLY